MQRPRFALLLLCAVLAATAATAAAGDDDAEKTLVKPLRNGVAAIGAHFRIPTGAKILPTLPTGLKLHKHKLPKLPTGLRLPRLPRLPTGIKLPPHKHGRRLSTTVTLAKFTLPTGHKVVLPTGPKFVIPTGFKKTPLPGLGAGTGGGRRLQGLKKILPTGPIFVIPTGPKFTIPTGPKFTIPTGFKKIPFPGAHDGAGSGRRLNTLKGLKKIIPTGPIFVLPNGTKFALPTGLKKKLPGKLGRRMN